MDTLSLDPSTSTTFPVHVNFLASDRFRLLEGDLNDLSEIQPRRQTLAYIGLIPWEEGSGGPCRILANW